MNENYFITMSDAQELEKKKGWKYKNLNNTK